MHPTTSHSKKKHQKRNKQYFFVKTYLFLVHYVRIYLTKHSIYLFVMLQINKKLISFITAFTLLFVCQTTYLLGQARIQVRVVSVAVLNNVDCDGFLTGNSDYVIEYIGTDNTLGNSNNNPVLFGFLGDFNHAYNNGNNGPWTLTSPNGTINPNNGIFFDYEYTCPGDIPTQINIQWQGYENDAPTNYDLTGGTFSEVRTGAQNGTIAVPAAPGTIQQTFNASGTSGCGTQNYRLILEVTRLPLAVNYLPNDICSAPVFPLNTTQRYGWCPNATLETNEPHRGDVTANGSVWFAFVAPPSGEVTVTTDLGGTDIGTYFEIYHAADGSACNTGIQIPTLVLVKDKFEYLSHIEFSDGTDFLGIDPEAEISLDACDPVNLISYQKLHPGQTYYVQLTADNNGDRGYVEIRVNDLGGSSPPNPEDIPCTSPSSTFGTGNISSGANSPATRTLNFGCAYDGGNDFGETGAQHTSPNPNDYHAYDYNHPASNNATMNESVWTNFIAPNSGRMYFETDYRSALYGENNALFGFDPRFAPGTPSDFSCANLTNLGADDGGVNGIFGNSNFSAIINSSCLEPGYRYYGMVDPSDNLTPLSTQSIDLWLYDPSIIDPLQNPPGNDILCLTLQDTLYRVPVELVGQTLPFQAVAGTNVRACIETLAGEPFSNAAPGSRANQTVWHYFVVPPSGVIEMRVRSYIGLNQLNYAIYPLLNGNSCYGGLGNATFTVDGTRLTPAVAPIYSGTAGFSGSTFSICCLAPGTLYAIQLDGGSPGDQGQYIIEFINEVEVYAGDSQFETMNGDTFAYNTPDTAFICYGDTIYASVMNNLLGQSTTRIPGCLDTGFVMHNVMPIPNPLSGSGFSFIDSVRFGPNIFVNNTDGSGSFGNPLFNTLYYVSALADEDTTWGQLICPSASIENGAKVVFLRPIVLAGSYDQNQCIINFSATGGLPSFNGSLFNYVITNTQGDTISGTTADLNTVSFQIPTPDTYTIIVFDSVNCIETFIVNASTCLNACITDPIQILPNPIDSSVYTCLPGGISATTTLTIRGGYPAANSSVYTITVSGSTGGGNGTFNLAGAPTGVPFSFIVNDGDNWTVIVTDTSGCTDTVSATFTYNLVNCPNYCQLNPITTSSSYTCLANGSAIVEITMGGGAPAINGSNYIVTVNGSSVLGQNFSNAQVPGNIGNTSLISFLVNDGDSWDVVVTDTNFCTDTITGTFVFNITNCPNLCQILPVQISPDPINSTVYSCNSDSSATVTLVFSGGDPALNNTNYTVILSGSTIAGQNGTYTNGIGTFIFQANQGDNWQVIVTDVNTCADTAIGIVSFNPISVNFISYICDPSGSAQVTVEIGGGQPAIDGSNYNLYVVGTTTGSNVVNAPLTGTIGGSSTYTFTVNNGDIWQVFADDIRNCTVGISDTFVWNLTNCGNLCTVPGYQPLAINGGSNTILYNCNGNGQATFNAQITGGLPGLGGLSTEYTVTITRNGIDSIYIINSTSSGFNYSLSLEDGDVWQIIATDALGCTSDSIGSVFISVDAIAQTDVPFEILIGDPAQLIGSSSTGNITNYSWTPIDNVVAPNAVITTTFPIITTIYTLEVSDAFGCTDSDTALVRVGPCVPDHAGFTPNADGVNDLWEIPCLNLLEGDLEVYNRWGQIVYMKDNYDGSWNGEHYQTNQDLPDATYYYVLKVKFPMYTNEVIYKGTVTIIR